MAQSNGTMPVSLPKNKAIVFINFKENPALAGFFFACIYATYGYDFGLPFEAISFFSGANNSFINVTKKRQ